MIHVEDFLALRVFTENSGVILMAGLCVLPGIFPRVAFSFPSFVLYTQCFDYYCGKFLF